METKATEDPNQQEQEEDMKGMHTFECGEHDWTVDEKYQWIEWLGYGRDGPECRVIDKIPNQLFLLKKIPEIFENIENARNIIREVCLTRFFDHENILKIVNIIQPKQKTTFQDVYLVTEYMKMTLKEIIDSNIPLQDTYIQFFLYQILRGIFYIHSAGIIHRNLRPKTLLVNEQCDLKISNFKFARPPKTEGYFYMEKFFDQHYESPEVLLDQPETQSMDIWAIGCIFGELLGRGSLFNGYDRQSQIEAIFRRLGTPKENDLGFKPSKKIQKLLDKLPKANEIPWSQRFPEANPITLDLLENILTINPEKRFTAFECLRHPYFKDLHDPDDEPVCLEKFVWNHKDEPEELLQTLLDEEIKNSSKFFTM